MICGKTFGKRLLEKTRNTREVDKLVSTECMLTIFGSSCQRVRNIIWRYYDHSFVCGYLQAIQLGIRLPTRYKFQTNPTILLYRVRQKYLTIL